MADPRPRFLIVDDSRAIRTHLKHLIRQVEAEVAGEAANGEEAVKQFTDLKPDVVLLDVNMPKMDGRAALKQIRALDPRAVIVMLTSQDTLDVVEECLQAGASNYVLKSNPDDAIITELKSTIAASAKTPAG